MRGEVRPPDTSPAFSEIRSTNSFPWAPWQAPSSETHRSRNSSTKSGLLLKAEGVRETKRAPQQSSTPPPYSWRAHTAISSGWCDRYSSLLLPQKRCSQNHRREARYPMLLLPPPCQRVPCSPPNLRQPKTERRLRRPPSLQ